MEFEIEYAKFTPTPKFYHKKVDSTPILDKNKNILLSLYKKMDEEVYNDYLLEVDKAEKYKAALETKICQHCGSHLRYIQQFDFWGCPNYKDGNQHSIVNEDREEYVPEGRVAGNWLTDIIREAGLQNQVKAKQLFEYYKSLGLQDLRERYNRSSSEIRLKSYTKTKERSYQQEQLIKEYLSKLDGKLVYQQCITYKLKDEKERFCIPDFILGTLYSVKVIDAKLSYYDDDKMDLYVSLVDFILKTKNDSRRVSGAHILYEDDFIIDGVPIFRCYASRHELFLMKKPDTDE